MSVTCQTVSRQWTMLIAKKKKNPTALKYASTKGEFKVDILEVEIVLSIGKY